MKNYIQPSTRVVDIRMEESILALSASEAPAKPENGMDTKEENSLGGGLWNN